MPRIRVLLADDHTIVVQGLQALLKDTVDVVGTVGDGWALIEAAQQLKPDVIVSDISMPSLNGLDAARHLRTVDPNVKIIILTMHAEPYLAIEAFRAGVSGYVLKSSAGDELIHAIQQVMQDRAYITPFIAKDVISVLMEARDKGETPEPRLTLRQREVLQLIGEGRTMKEIAGTLNISSRTAESHKYEIMDVLGAQTTAELVQYAIRLRLITI